MTLHLGGEELVTVSLCMIVKDEEQAIGRCLDSVKDLVDEIVIVDTGSTDRTKEIVRRYTDRIYDFQWIDDFAAARNYSFGQAAMDYILWLDADDVLLEEDRKKFVRLKEQLDPHIDAVTMDYHLAFDANGNVTFRTKRHRLVRRERGFRWVGAVHEYLEVRGNILHSDVAVTHRGDGRDPERNLRIYDQRLARGETFSPRDLYYFANELCDHRQYDRAVYYYEKFLDTKKGWVEDNISACGRLADCYFALREPEKAYQTLTQCLSFGPPRAEICCRIGYYFFQKGDFRTAIFWYNLATQQEPSSQEMGFVNTAWHTWFPHLQLCICYDRLGEHETAYHHNEMARKYQPNSPQVLHNKRYLEEVLYKKKGG